MYFEIENRNMLHCSHLTAVHLLSHDYLGNNAAFKCLSKLGICYNDIIHSSQNHNWTKSQI